MKITCYILDDEYHAIEILKAYIEKTPGLELTGFATDPLQALNDVARVNGPALLFLDVNMPELSGMEFSAMVNIYTTIVFTTSFAEYALEAFEKEAFDFLLKPISYERFFKAVQKMRKNLMIKEKGLLEKQPFFFIKTETKGKLNKVIAGDILYIEAAQNYVRIHTIKQIYTTYLTLEEILGFLPSALFSRVHRSYVIMNSRIVSVEPGQVTLENKIVIPIGATYRDSITGLVRESLLESRRKL